MPFTSDTASEAGSKSSRLGRPNKSTTEIRELFQGLLEDNMDTLQDDLKQLEPQQRIKAILDLSKYVLPSLKSVEYIEKKKENNQLDVSKLTFEELKFLSDLYKKYSQVSI